MKSLSFLLLFPDVSQKHFKEQNLLTIYLNFTYIEKMLVIIVFRGFLILIEFIAAPSRGA